jgi:hypothetical protein
VSLPVALVISAAGLAAALLVLQGTLGRHRVAAAAPAFEDDETLGFE